MGFDIDRPFTFIGISVLQSSPKMADRKKLWGLSDRTSFDLISPKGTAESDCQRDLGQIITSHQISVLSPLIDWHKLMQIYREGERVKGITGALFVSDSWTLILDKPEGLKDGVRFRAGLQHLFSLILSPPSLAPSFPIFCPRIPPLSLSLFLSLSDFIQYDRGGRNGRISGPMSDE